MTEGDKIKLRAELAGMICGGIRANESDMKKYRDQARLGFGDPVLRAVSKYSIKQADALMAELGISMEDDK